VPYYIYQIKPFSQLDKLTEHPNFAAASQEAKTLRAALPTGTLDTVKVIFAENESQAQDLLRQTREAGPTGED